MKLHKLTFIAALSIISTGALAQKGQPLPNVQPPRELVETGSEFVEGTITKLTEKEINHFLPWAQNAQNVLTKALADIETMPVEDQVKHLTAVMKSVVRNSGDKKYQMFMRFSLNRTMLLVQEFSSQVDWKLPGTVENVLDLQVTGIKIALSFYESDLDYQRRSRDGKSSVILNYANFGINFGKGMLESIQNIFDASAQYRLLYKSLEMLNWDLSRDENAIDLSDYIVEVYNTLSTLDEQPSQDDITNVSDIRRLNVLTADIKKLNNQLISLRQNREKVLEAERFKKEIESKVKLGSKVYVLSNNTALPGIVWDIRETTAVVKMEDNNYLNVSYQNLAFTYGCYDGFCIGEETIVQSRVSNGYYSYHDVFVEGKILAKHNGGFIMKIGEKAELSQSISHNSLSKMKGCYQNFCVNDKIFNLVKKQSGIIKGWHSKNGFIVSYDNSSLSGYLNAQNLVKE